MIQRLMLLPLAAMLTAAGPPATPSPISAARIRADVAVLASDRFAGRGPGEAGERATLAFLSRQFARIGLTPAGDDGYRQRVPLVRYDRAPGARMTLALGGATLALVPGRDVALTLAGVGETRLERLPLVFAGFGVVDAARGWNPYAGLDMTGKVAVVLAGDPDGEAGQDLGFEGRRLVVAGRFGSKVAAATAAGAAGVVVIHEDFAASYPFAQLVGTDTLPRFALASTPLPRLARASTPPRGQFSAWLSGAVAARLLAAHGLDLPTAKQRARSPAFRAVPLADARLSVTGRQSATRIISHNVVGVLRGATRPDEFVLYGAHWDANGDTAPDARGDRIRNGAIDNATGTAELIEIARAFAAGPRPARSIVFAAWTAEEKGLLGAEHYVAQAGAPLATTAAVINLDPHVVLPAARNLELVGAGRTTLEDDLRAAAAAMGLAVTDEPNPEAGWYFRSDHYPFARSGVPALSFRAGRDLVEGGFARGDAMVGAYNQRCYHQPCDAFDPAWTFAGTAQEAEAAWRVGRAVADSAGWPGWTPDAAEFARVRAASAGRRAPAK